MAGLLDMNHNPESVVRTFLENVGTFQYEKAKDLVDKQKEYCKSNAHDIPGIWPTILSSLSMLAVAEKSYSSFLYLSPKWFGRKDAKSVYDVVATEFKKIDDYGMNPNAKLASLAHICGQLVPYVQLKAEMTNFFSSLHAMTSVKFGDRGDLLVRIQNVLTSSTVKFYHPQLEHIKFAFISECEVLQALLEADMAVSKWYYADSLLHLQSAHTKISQLLTSVSSHASRSSTLGKFNIFSIRTNSTPPLYSWLKQYKNEVYSKFSLYFYDVLSKYAPQGDMRTYLSRCATDHYSKLLIFHKKFDAYLIALVLKSDGLRIKGPGYSQVEINPETLQGKDGYVAIFGYPNEILEQGVVSNLPCLPLFHQTDLVMILGSNDSQLSQSDKPVDFYDESHNILYIVSRIDAHVSLVVIFKSKKSDREKKSMLGSLQEISSLLRYTKLFTDLRPS